MIRYSVYVDDAGELRLVRSTLHFDEWSPWESCTQDDLNEIASRIGNSIFSPEIESPIR